MKTLSSVIFIIVLLTLSGCSDTSNPIKSSPEPEISEYNDHEQLRSNRELIWSHNGISITANGEGFVNDEILCDFHNSRRSGVIVMFDGWTDADTTSYISKVVIEIDGKMVFLESGELYINRYHELFFDNIGAGNLRFFVSLWCDDVKCNSTAALKLSKIEIYRY